MQLDLELAPIHVRNDLSDVVGYIKKSEKKNKVFSIAGFGQRKDADRADIFQTLNLHREYFIEKGVLSIIWVTEKEAQELSLAAPDFWAFRHRVIDFLSDRATPHRSAVFEGLIWIEWPWYIFEDNTQGALSYRKELLNELPEAPETALIRINLYAEMAGLYVEKENWVQALDSIQCGLDHLPSSPEPELEARLCLGLATILVQMEHYTQAHAALHKAKLLAPTLPGILTLLAQINRKEGRRSEALSLIKKEIRLCPESARAWNECGNIYADLGRNLEALNSYQKASNFSPELAIPLINKSAVMASENRLDDALSLLNILTINKNTDLKEIAKRQGFEFLNEIT